MSIQLHYIASSGNVYNMKADGIRTKKANYHKWKWGVNGTALQYGLRVSDFTMKPAEYETTLIFEGSYNDRKELIEALHEDFELDVRTMRPGRIIWGDYYIDCFVISSSTEPNAQLDLWTDNTVKLYCPHPFWIKEETKEFFPRSVPAGQVFLDYPFDYQYDYFYGNPGIGTWQTGFPFESKFKLTIYGAVSDPRIQINGYPYQVFSTLAEGEYLVIDSRNNTITKYPISGNPVNLFDNRDKMYSVFKSIPGGMLKLNWTGAFGFDLTLFEERSEPRSDIGV